MMVDRNSLSIAYGAAIVGHASALVCYPAYTLGRTYVNGEWASASVLTTVTSIASVACSPPGVDDCLITGVRSEDRFSSTEMYNFQCILDDNVCSNAEYAPDSINSDLAWARDSTACSTVEVEQNVVPTDASSADDADDIISVARSISRKLQTSPTSQPTTIQPTTLQPTSPTNFPTTPVPTPTATTALPTTAKPTTSTPTSQKPTSLPTNVSPISTPQPTLNPTTAQPNAGRVTFNPTTLPPTPIPTNPTTPIPTPMPVPGTTTPLPTPIPTTPAAPVTNRPTRKPNYYPSPRPPNQCLCPCPGSKSSKTGKNGKSSTTTKAGKTRTKAGKLCPCPCRPVVIPPCYRCRPHVIGRTNRIPQTKFIA